MSFLHDIRIALRSLRARPTYALVALLTLTLVVGAGGAVLAVINATFIRPLPFADESRLVSVFALPPGIQNALGGTSLFSGAFVRMRESLRTVESVAGIWQRERALMVNGEAETIQAAGISPDYFQVLGVPLAAGRTFTSDEDLTAASVAIVSDAFARNKMGTDSPVGRKLVIDGAAVDVIGVLPNVSDPTYLSADVYTPLNIHRGNQPVPSSTIVVTVARLRPGVTAEQARAEVQASMKEITTELSSLMKGWTASAVVMREGLFGDTRPALTVLFLAICLLTAIACANLANVTLAEMSSRRDEITLRTALGSSRAALIRLVATEHVLVALIGGAAGLLVARAALPAILALDSSTAASLGDVTIDWRVQVGALMLALIVSVLSGVLPTLSATRGDLARGLAQSSRRTAGSKRQARTRAVLVAIETTIASVLLISSALLLTGFNKSAALDPGFDPANVLGAQLRLPAATYPGHAERAAFVRRVVEEVRAVPGVVSAGAAFNTFRGGGGFLTSINVDGKPTADGQPRSVQFRRASPGYFETMKIAQVRGRTFTDADVTDSQWVVVISRQLADLVWPGEEAIGRQLSRASDPTHPFTVIGIVDDVRDRGLELPTLPTIYLAYGQNTNGAAPISLVVRTSGDSGAYRQAVAQAVHRVDPSLPLSDMTTLESFLSRTLGPSRFRSVLLLAFALLGLALAVVGIYGVTSRGVSERTRELGIRLALGSGRGQLWRMVLRQSLSSVGIGLAIGLPVSVIAGLLISRAVPGIVMSDVWLALPSVVVLALAGGVAAAAPTLRATRIDPVVALRD